MNADYVKATAQTGDGLGVHGSSAEQEVIQALTGILCHVAPLLRMPNGELIIAEMIEPHGYRTISFDDWMQERTGQVIFFLQAPDAVRQGGDKIIARQALYKDAQARNYAFEDLPLVLLSQITGKKYDTGGEVCSEKYADDYAAAGQVVPGNPSPTDFVFLSESVAMLR